MLAQAGPTPKFALHFSRADLNMRAAVVKNLESSVKLGVKRMIDQLAVGNCGLVRLRRYRQVSQFSKLRPLVLLEEAQP